MGLRRAAQVAAVALVLVAGALWSAGAIHVEDWQLHVFPGGVSGPGVGQNVVQFGADPTGAFDSSGPIQAAIDTCQSPLVFPTGIYTACNLLPRCPNQKWVGAGKGMSIIRGNPSSCNNVIVTSCGTCNPVAFSQGPVAEWDISGFTFLATVNQSLINISGHDVFRVHIHDNAFDLTGTGDTQGILVTGSQDVDIVNNEFYSSTPGHGKAIVFTRNPARAYVGGNTDRWTYQFLEWGTEGTDGLRAVDNFVMLGWPFMPTKVGSTNNANCTAAGFPEACCTGAGTGTCNPGGGITYADGVLTDPSASFTGLCNDDGASPPQTCGAGLGNFIRILTPVVTGTGSVNFNNGGNIITDAGVNFNTAPVKEGYIVKTPKMCTGNGTLSALARGVCTAPAGTSAWGDRCVCTSNADCASGVCESRFTFATRVNDNTHLAVSEWVSDTTRRPVGPPIDATAGIYTVYSWVTCKIGSYTATTVSCDAVSGNHFKAWDLGTIVTPANGTTYEIGTRHPNYPFLENTASTNSQLIGNSIDWGYADNIFIQGSGAVVMGNHASNCADHCFNIGGAQNPTGAKIIGNSARHFGVRGVADFSPSSTMTGNVGLDGPVFATGFSNCPIVFGTSGTNSATIADNRAINTVVLANSTSGFCIQNTSTGAILDNPQCVGTFTKGCIRLDGPANLQTHIEHYHGEVISKMQASDCTANGIPQACCTGAGVGATCGNGTYSIEGGFSTQALIVANSVANGNAPLPGSYVGCQDCTVAAPTAAGGNGAVAIYSTTGPQWNGR